MQDEREDGSVGRFAYSTDLFDWRRARLAEHWNVCSRNRRRSRTPISELAILGDAERETLLDSWNRTDAPFPEDRCIHELIEDKSACAPTPSQ